MHKRVLPHNFFNYKAGYVLLSLMENAKKPWFFSEDKFNIFSFYNKDHANRNGQKTLEWVFEKLENAGIKKESIAKILLLTHPRCFGFVFNPVSFYFCFNLEGKMQAVIAEVNNTFGKTHSYVIQDVENNEIISHKIYTTPKEFFVSPFFQKEGHYEFRFAYLEEKIAIFINYYIKNTLKFETSLVGKVVDFNFKNAMPYFFTTFKTVILIGFQALKLVAVKKVKFRKPKTKENFTQTIIK